MGKDAGGAFRGTFLKESFPYNPSKNFKKVNIHNFGFAFFCLLFFRERKVSRVPIPNIKKKG